MSTLRCTISPPLHIIFCFTKLTVSCILHAESTRQMPSVYLRSSLSRIVYNLTSKTAVSSKYPSAENSQDRWDLSVPSTHRNWGKMTFSCHSYKQLSIPLSGSFISITSSLGLWVTSSGLLGFCDVLNQVPNKRQKKKNGICLIKPSYFLRKPL